MNNEKTSEKKIQSILDLYVNSNYNGTKIIALIIGVSDTTVCSVIDLYFEKKIQYKKTNYKLYHSKMNFDE